MTYKRRAKKRIKRAVSALEDLALRMTRSVGSVESLIIHTFLFLGAFALALLGFDLEIILLVLTTVVSLEAIYLAIFIQMTVNKSEERLDEIAEDVEDLEEDLDEIAEDIEEDEREEIARDKQMMEKIEGTLAKLMKEIEGMKKK